MPLYLVKLTSPYKPNTSQYIPQLNLFFQTYRNIFEYEWVAGGREIMSEDELLLFKIKCPDVITYTKVDDMNEKV